MHDRTRTLALGLSAFLLMSCASSPPRPSGSADAASSPTRPSAHELFFADMVAAVAALGGTNPNPPYRAISAGAVSTCSGGNAQQPGLSRPMASCQHLAAFK